MQLLCPSSEAYQYNGMLIMMSIQTDYALQNRLRGLYISLRNTLYSMCSLVVSVLDSSAVDPGSNPGSGSALLMSEKAQAVYYISSCHMLIDKALSSDKTNGHWFEADCVHCKRDALSRNRKIDGSRLTGCTQACHS